MSSPTQHIGHFGDKPFRQSLALVLTTQNKQEKMQQKTQKNNKINKWSDPISENAQKHTKYPTLTLSHQANTGTQVFVKYGTPSFP